MGECIERLTSIVLKVDVEDHWVWNLRSSFSYTITSAYTNLSEVDDNKNKDNSKFLWLKTVLLKVSIFVWRMFFNRIPTKDNLAR